MIKEIIMKEDLDKLKEILVGSPSLIEENTTDGIPLPFIAAKTGNLDMVKYIVEYSRASMNTKDLKFRSILHYGVMSGNLEVVKYLVEKVGMSPKEGDYDLITPFDIAKEKGFDSIEEYFTKICGVPLDKMYRNPIRRGMFPDPSIVRVEDDYYMVNSSFIYFPCIPISHSKDLIHWTIIGHAITNPEWAHLEGLEGGRGYWAPDISYYKGRFYITATYRLNDTGTVYRKQMVTSSKDPQGPYNKPVFIDEDGIDPSIFNDEDGRRYMLLNRGARIFELNEEGTEKISEARLLYYGDQKRAPEGPHLIKRKGYYYLFLAEGGTGPGHRITVARARSLEEAFQPCPYNPIMRQWVDDSPLTRCGHGKPVQTQDGQWYMVYLCGRSLDGYTILGRETALDPIQWTPDGWPIVNQLQGPSTLQKIPSIASKVQEKNKENTNFIDKNQKLNKDWVFPRPPVADGYLIKGNQVLLRGSQEELDKKEARNILLRRQVEFNFTASVLMKHITLENSQNAGLTCYYDENTWIKFGLFHSQAHGNKLSVVEHIDMEEKVAKEEVFVPESVKNITLCVVTKGLKRSFYYQFDNQKKELLTSLDNVYYLSDEGIKKGKRFTGAMVGVYAYGGNSKLYVPFENFTYQS